MTKKYLLTGAVVAGLLTATQVSAPTKMEAIVRFFPKQGLEKIAAENFGEDFVRRQEEWEKILDELELCRKDKVYGFVYNVYFSLNAKSKIPKHITKPLIRQIIRQESSDNPRAKGKNGEIGYMQPMEDTWLAMGGKNFERDAFIPEMNIEVGIKKLLDTDKSCSRYYPGWEKLDDWSKQKILVASYNGGWGTLKAKGWNINKMKKVTIDYIKKLTRWHNSLQENSI